LSFRYVFSEDHYSRDRTKGVVPGMNFPSQPLHTAIGTLKSIALVSNCFTGKRPSVDLLPAFGNLREYFVVR